MFLNFPSNSRYVLTLKFKLMGNGFIICIYLYRMMCNSSYKLNIIGTSTEEMRNYCYF